MIQEPADTERDKTGNEAVIPTEISAAIIGQPLQSLTDILDNVPKVTSAIAAGSIAIAVAYQLGYFIAIDVKLFSYLTIQDSLLDALRALPVVTFVAGSLFAIGPFYRFLRKHKYMAMDA